MSREFLIGDSPGSISAAVALRDMIAGDPHSCDGKADPLIRDPSTGQELRYEYALAEFKRIAAAAGYAEIGKWLHSLRMGGATAYDNSRIGGDLAALAAGEWKSNAR